MGAGRRAVAVQRRAWLRLSPQDYDKGEKPVIFVAFVPAV